MNEKPLVGLKPTPQQVKYWGKDITIVPILEQHVTLPKVNLTMVPEDSYWVYDTKNNLPMHLFTRMPKSEVDVAWTTCGGCMSPPYNCTCSTGLRVTRSVEYIWDKNQAAIKGEEWNIYHPNYYGSIIKAARTRSAEERARKTLVKRGVVTEPPKPPQKVLKRAVKKPADVSAVSVGDVSINGLEKKAGKKLKSATEAYLAGAKRPTAKLKRVKK